MIKNKKAMSKLLISLITLVIGFTIFALSYPNTVSNLSKQISSKASIDKYLPSTLIPSKEPLSEDNKIIAFSLFMSIIDNHFLSKHSANQINKGQFYLITKDISDEKLILGFTKREEGNRVYTSFIDNSATYYDKTLFENEQDRETVNKALENKKFVVMNTGKDKNDPPMFLYQVTGLSIDNRNFDDIKSDSYYSLNNILKRNIVYTLSFSTQKKSKIYYTDYENNAQEDTISKPNQKYILIWRMDDYVVFFPQSGYTATELTNKNPIEINGDGLTSPDLIDDLIRENMIVYTNG